MSVKEFMLAMGGPRAQQVADQRRENRTMTALGSYLGQGASPELAAVYQNDPRAAFEAEGLAQERENKLRASVGNMAEYLDAVPPEHKAAAYAQLVPQLQKAFPGMPVPTEYGPEVEAVLPQVRMLAAGAGQRSQGRDGKVVGNALVDPITGDVIYKGEDQPVNGQIVPVPDGRGGFVQMVFDQRTRQFSMPQYPGQAQGAPQQSYAGGGVGSGQPIGGAVVDPQSGQADPTIAALPPEQQQTAFRLMAMNRPFHIKDGQVIEGMSAGSGAPQQAPQEAALPPLSQWGAGDERLGYTPPKDDTATESFSQPQAVTGPDGRVQFVQFGNRGSQREVPGYKPAPTDRDNKPPTEGERAASGYLNRMNQAELEMEATLAAGHDPGNMRDYTTAGQGPLLNWAASDEGQKYRQAQEDWVRSKLRKESGAVIGDDEMAREIKVYFPQPGDSPTVIEQKKRSRATAIEQMRRMAGRAESSRAADAPAETPASGSWGIVKVR